ncbi:hypothetical protein PG993_013349 [Apiospora rasikravindrae]|uniref:Uncharacterized protein n=1 Tax=Apiospora rasikravindrae TaxID=990691 RepID=A0ABR1RYM2_9PEZI
MQSENATKNAPLTNNNEDFSMFGTDTVRGCEKDYKHPCMNIFTDCDMSLEGCDMLDLENMEMQLPFTPFPDTEVFLLPQEAPQDFQQVIDASTWEMDLIDAYDDMNMDLSESPIAPDYFWPHGGPFLPPTEQEQDEEPHRPREPFAAVGYPQPIVQSYGPPPWYGEPCPFDEGIAMSHFEGSLWVNMDPLDHEEWASPGISPVSMEQDAVPEMNLTETLPAVVDFGTPISSDPGYDTGHHSERGHHNPASSKEDAADWDNVPYQGIPPQVLCVPFATLLELNESFRDLIELQWPEVMEMYAQLPCRDVFANFPTIRGLATMFNLRLPGGCEEDAEREEHKEGDHAPANDTEKQTLQRAMP